MQENACEMPDPQIFTKIAASPAGAEGYRQNDAELYIQSSVEKCSVRNIFSIHSPPYAAGVALSVLGASWVRVQV